MRWEFSDGTTVELGGKVDGPTLLAQRLRAELARGARVQVWAEPEEPHAVDVNDPALLDAWLRSELDFWTRVRELPLTLSAPAGVPPLPEPPWALQPQDPSAVY